MWVEKYRPGRIEKMVGNEEARSALGTWLSEWKPGDKAALLLGPPGTGKTTLVGLLAKRAKMNIVELNASDTRTRDGLQRRMGEATKSRSLFGEKMLILLDEVDGLLGRADIGGVDFIKEAAKETKNPIAMTANDPDSDEVRKLASVCLAVRFRPPPPREVELYLRMIAENEGVELTEEALRMHVRSSGGDIRFAINSLQSRGRATADGQKDVSVSVSQGLDRFFEAEDEGTALAALKGLSLDPFAKVRELHRCVVRSGLPGGNLSRALDALSRADTLVGRMTGSGSWRLLRYLDATIARDLFPAIRGRGVRYVTDDLPFPMMLRIWNDSRKVREISSRYAARTHTTSRSARTQDLPYLFSLCSTKKFREELERSLDLDETYDRFLKKEAER